MRAAGSRGRGPTSRGTASAGPFAGARERGGEGARRSADAAIRLRPPRAGALVAPAPGWGGRGRIVDGRSGKLDRGAWDKIRESAVREAMRLSAKGRWYYWPRALGPDGSCARSVGPGQRKRRPEGSGRLIEGNRLGGGGWGSPDQLACRLRKAGMSMRSRSPSSYRVSATCGSTSSRWGRGAPAVSRAT